MRLAELLRLVATAAAIFLVASISAEADGIPGVVMTDSQYLTDWSGFYVGGKLGGAFSNITWTQDLNAFTALSGVPPNTPVQFSPSGVAGGFLGGANLQLGQWIFGGEVSFSGTDLSQKTTSPFFPATDTISTTLDWLLTVEGRLGYSWDRVMVFGKGGLAATDATLKVTSTHPVHVRQGLDGRRRHRICRLEQRHPRHRVRLREYQPVEGRRLPAMR